jgi:hypothetical protein
MKADFAKRLHDREQTALFIGRFRMTNLTEDDRPGIGEGPRVARSKSTFARDVV